MWKCTCKFERSFQLGMLFGLIVLHVHHGQWHADDSSDCQHLRGGRKSCDSRKAVPCLSLPDPCLGLELTAWSQNSEQLRKWNNSLTRTGGKDLNVTQMLCSVHSLSAWPRRKTYQTFKCLLCQKQTLNFSWVLSSPCCGICWNMPPGDWERKNRATSTTYCKPAVSSASKDLQQLPGFTWDCKQGEIEKGRGGGQFCVQESLMKLNCSCSD